MTFKAHFSIPLGRVVPDGSTMALHTAPVFVGDPQVKHEAEYVGYHRIPVPPDGEGAHWPENTGPGYAVCCWSVAGPNGRIEMSQGLNGSPQMGLAIGPCQRVSLENTLFSVVN